MMRQRIVKIMNRNLEKLPLGVLTKPIPKKICTMPTVGVSISLPNTNFETKSGVNELKMKITKKPAENVAIVAIHVGKSKGFDIFSIGVNSDPRVILITKLLCLTGNVKRKYPCKSVIRTLSRSTRI